MRTDPKLPYRVAIYYAPDPKSAWWNAGSRWLGRCAATNMVLKQPPVRSIPAAEFHQLTAEPRRYGWHATIKAPFQLAPGCSLDQLCASVEEFCQTRTPIELPPLQVSSTGNFLSLRPLQNHQALEALASSCVQQLHELAAPLSESELARRRRGGLTAEQDALLMAWGYPWVMQHFRFHLSLTGPLTGLAPGALEGLIEEAAAQFHRLPACTVDRLSVFVEPISGGDFLLHKQFELSS